MIRSDVAVLQDATKWANTPVQVVTPRKRGRPRKKDQNGSLIINVKKEILEESSNNTTSITRRRSRAIRRSERSSTTYSFNGVYTPANLISNASSRCSSSMVTSTSQCNSDQRSSVDPSQFEIVNVHELWDHYLARAEYQDILSTSVKNCHKSRQRVQDRKSLAEKIAHLRRIEEAIAQGVRQITTFEFFNYVNPLCPGLNDVATELYMISCDDDKVIQSDTLSNIVVPCRSAHHHDPPVIYYPVPAAVEKNAKSVFLVVKVHIEQKYHFIGSARRWGRSRGEQEDEEHDSPVLKRILYGVRKVACGEEGTIYAAFGNHTIVLVNSDNDAVEGIHFKITDEKWMSSYAQLDHIAKIGNKLCSSGPIGLINFGISDEHVEFDWNVVECVMDARYKRKNMHSDEPGVVVWYHYECPNSPSGAAVHARGSPSSDKENSIARSVKALESPFKSPRKISPRKAIGSPSKLNERSPTTRESAVRALPVSPKLTMSPTQIFCQVKSPKSPTGTSPKKETGLVKLPMQPLSAPVGGLPYGVFDYVRGHGCPFTGKLFESAQELEEYLGTTYPVFKFKKLISAPFALHFLVSSAVTRADWERPPLDPESSKKVSIGVSSPKRKVIHVPPSDVPVKRKNELPKAQMIPFGEMSFVPPTYSRVPGPSSAKVYHSVIEDTCDWKMHLMERNIRDYIDDTPQEKEFMLLHNRFRSKFRHSIVGEKLTLDFYTKFVESCGMEMKKKRIRAHCVARLARLVQREKMSPNNMAHLTQKLYELGPNDKD